MTVKELAEKLSTMSPDAEVAMLWDGAARGSVDHVWVAHSGQVVMSGCRDVVYETRDRPASAPTSREQQFWYTPDLPGVL